MNKLITGLIVMSGIVGSWYVFKNKTLSVAGVAKLKKHEALRLSVYNDSRGLPTIGWGHLLLSNEIGVLNNITIEQADALFVRDLVRFENVVNDNVTVPLTQNMYDSLVSLSYNIGVHGFKSSTTLRELNNGNYVAAANAIKLWNKETINGVKRVSRGLSNRRESEQQVFFS